MTFSSKTILAAFGLSHKKIGGIHFVRLGRLRLSFSIARKPVTVVRYLPGVVMRPETGPHYFRDALMSDGSVVEVLA